MNNNIGSEKIRRIRKSLGKRPHQGRRASQNFENVKEKLLDDIKSEIENFLKFNNKKLDVTFDDYLAAKDNFMKFEYTDQVFHMINKIVSIITRKIPDKVLLNASLQKSLIYTVKAFMMNEVEIVFLSIYLEKVNWHTGLIGLQDNLMLTALYVKILLNDQEQEIVLKFLVKEKLNLIQNTLKIWIALNKGLDYIHINMNQLNQRTKEIKEYNINCKKDYIDYNSIIENILNISSDYNDGNKKKESSIQKQKKYYKKKFEKSINPNKKIKKILEEEYNKDTKFKLDIEENNNNNNNTSAEILDVDEENNYILNLNDNKKPVNFGSFSFKNDANDIYNLLKNPHLFSFKNSAKNKKEEKINIEFSNDIIRKEVFNSIKDNVNTDNVVFDTSKVKVQENDKEDEDLFMFYSTKPCSNDVQEKANIV